jgi:hypothetical protein
VHVWDTHGSDERADWTELVRPGARIKSIRNLVMETGAASFVWAGSRSTPAAFAQLGVEQRGLPYGPTPVDGYEPGGATLTSRDGAQARLSFGQGARAETLIVRAGYHGYERRVGPHRGPGPVRSGLNLGVVTPPFAVTNGAGVVGGTVNRPASLDVDLPAGGAAVLVTGRSAPALFVSSSSRFAVRVRADGAGRLHRVTVERQNSSLAYSLYYAELPTFAPPYRTAITSSSALLQPGKRRWTFTVLTGGRASHGARDAVVLPLMGPGSTFATVLGEATGSFGAP